MKLRRMPIWNLAMNRAPKHRDFLDYDVVSRLFPACRGSIPQLVLLDTTHFHNGSAVAILVIDVRQIHSTHDLNGQAMVINV